MHPMNLDDGVARLQLSLPFRSLHQRAAEGFRIWTSWLVLVIHGCKM